MSAKILDFEQPLKHYAVIDTAKFFKKPENLGFVTNEIKRIRYAEPYSAKELLQFLGSGYCVLLSNFALDENNKFIFLSASAFAIDVDDDDMITDPIQVLEEFKDICTGLFYTFSHGIKGNRYRLFFQLDQDITNEDDFKILVDYVRYRLKNKGVPVDESGSLRSPTQIIRPGNLGYVVNDLSVTLPVNKWLAEAKIYAQIQRKRREEQQKKRAARFKDTLLQSVTFEELKEMCEAIGYIPSGAGLKEQWYQVVFALKNEVILGNLSDQEGFELYSIVSGSEATERNWNGLRPRGEGAHGATVGSIIKLAKEAGYKRKHKYNYALQEVTETIPTERIKIDQYLSSKTAIELIERKQSLLVDSPTGSGKTTAFIEAFKELVSRERKKVKSMDYKEFINRDYHYYIFAAPTIPLTEQVAKDHDLFCITGATKHFRNKVTDMAIGNERVFVCTYDKAADVIRYLAEDIDYKYKQPTFTVVIDEIHKFTEAYNYRFAAIDKIKRIAEKTTSFIGISGTVEDVLKDHFDALIKIDKKDSSSPCTDYRVFTYEKRTDADVMLIPVIQGLLKQTKVLLFINSKKRIERIKNLLRMEGIKIQVVTSDSKQSPTYLNIVENRTIPENIDVLISTTVLADGVTIENELNWSCLVVSDAASPIFNPSTVKQMSNRFRNKYRYFILYMMQPNPKYTETFRFNIESEYQYRTKIVSSYVDYLNEEFDDYSQFAPSLIEQKNGIFYRSQEENAKIEYNPLFVRHESMRRKERFYNLFRNAFIQEVGGQLGVKCNGIINVNEEIEKHGADLGRLFEIVESLQEQEREENAALRAAFKDYFDEDIYQAFIDNDDKLLEVFRGYVHPEQVAAVRRIVNIADYQTCCKVGQAIKRKADVNKYFNHIKALADIAYFESVKKTTVTKKVYQALLKMQRETYSSNDFKDIVQNKLPEKLKVQPKDVKEALQLFHEQHSRINKERRIQIEPLTIEIVAEIHGITEAAIKDCLLKYVCTKNGQQQKILLPAIQAKWDI